MESTPNLSWTLAVCQKKTKKQKTTTNKLDYTGAGSYFVVHPLSANITMECVFPEGITNLNWTNRRTNTETVRLMTGPMNTTAVISLTLTQEVHGHTYVCQGVDSRGTLKYKHYKVIAKGEKNVYFIQ